MTDTQKILSELSTVRMQNAKILRMLENDKSEWVDSVAALEILGYSNKWVLTQLRKYGFLKLSQKVKNEIHYNRVELTEVKNKIENKLILIKGSVVIPNA